MEDHEIVSEDCLHEAKEVLGGLGGDHTERLAKALCVLLGGIIDKLLEEYEPREEQS